MEVFITTIHVTPDDICFILQLFYLSGIFRYSSPQNSTAGNKWNWRNSREAELLVWGANGRRGEEICVSRDIDNRRRLSVWCWEYWLTLSPLTLSLRQGASCVHQPPNMYWDGTKGLYLITAKLYYSYIIGNRADILYLNATTLV